MPGRQGEILAFEGKPLGEKMEAASGLPPRMAGCGRGDRSKAICRSKTWCGILFGVVEAKVRWSADVKFDFTIVADRAGKGEFGFALDLATREPLSPG
jgi:hypothetical protein